MKRIPPYVVVALCGLLFISAGLIGMFANNTDEVVPTDGAVAVVVLPTETPTLTPLPVVEVAPVVEQPPIAPVDAAPVVVAAPIVVVEPLPTMTIEILPSPTAIVPAEIMPVDGAPVEAAPVEVVPAEVAPVVIVPTEEVVPMDQPPLPDGVVPIPTALPPVEIAPTEIVVTTVVPLEIVPTAVVPLEIIPTVVVPEEGVPVGGRYTVPLDAAPVPTRGVPVDSVTSPTPETPAAEVIVPEQPLPVDSTPIIPAVDPAALPTAEGAIATVVPADTLNPAGTAHLSGMITFQDAQEHSGIVLLLTSPDGTQLQNTTSAPGTFEFLNLQAGSYRVEASSTGYLSRQIEFTLAEGETLQLPATFLVGGDTNSDNVIDVSDAALVALNFDGPALDLTSDPNRDGWIDVRDLALIGADFGLTGPIPWQ